MSPNRYPAKISRYLHTFDCSWYGSPYFDTSGVKTIRWMSNLWCDISIIDTLWGMLIRSPLLFKKKYDSKFIKNKQQKNKYCWNRFCSCKTGRMVDFAVHFNLQKTLHVHIIIQKTLVSVSRRIDFIQTLIYASCESKLSSIFVQGAVPTHPWFATTNGYPASPP